MKTKETGFLRFLSATVERALQVGSCQALEEFESTIG
jgi:hypothetical protein